jgi:4'-phosphopantetheinyl transferase EntD
MNSTDFALHLARPLFQTYVALAATDPAACHPEIEEEVESLPKAVPARRKEFVAGRAAAHKAMRQLGVAPSATLHGSDRAPIWPDGLTGSISHIDTVCLAAVAPADKIRSIGIDIEAATGLDAELIPLVCTAEEQHWLDSLTGIDKSLAAKVVFAAKECAYKAQYPLSQTLFGFETLSVSIEHDFQAFSANFMQDVGPFEAGHTLQGNLRLDDGLIVAGMTFQA